MGLRLLSLIQKVSHPYQHSSLFSGVVKEPGISSQNFLNRNARVGDSGYFLCDAY